MNNKILAAVMLIFLSATLVTAIEPTFVFRQGLEADLKFSCFDEKTGEQCDTTYACNLTVQYPNTSLLINNLLATRQGGFYNFTLPNTDVLGFHQYQAYCINGSDGGFSPELNYQINTTGENFTLSKSVLYIFVLILTLTLFGLFLWGAIKIPFKNTRDERGNIVSINDLKWVKIILWYMAFLTAIFLMFMAKTITGLLEIQLATGFFGFLYWFLISILIPITILTPIVMIISFFNDKKLKELIIRGITFR